MVVTVLKNIASLITLMEVRMAEMVTDMWINIQLMAKGHMRISVPTTWTASKYLQGREGNNTMMGSHSGLVAEAGVSSSMERARSETATIKAKDMEGEAVDT